MSGWGAAYGRWGESNGEEGPCASSFTYVKTCRIMSNLFCFCIVPNFPNLKVLKIFISDHITCLLKILQWLPMAFMVSHTAGLSQAPKVVRDLFPALLAAPHPPGIVLVSSSPPLCWLAAEASSDSF